MEVALQRTVEGYQPYGWAGASSSFVGTYFLGWSRWRRHLHVPASGNTSGSARNQLFRNTSLTPVRMFQKREKKRGVRSISLTAVSCSSAFDSTPAHLHKPDVSVPTVAFISPALDSVSYMRSCREQRTA